MKETLHKAPAPAAPLWRNHDFLLASGSRFFAAAGMGAVVITVMLRLQAESAGNGSGAGPWLVAAYLACSALPLVLLAPWAGRLADTRDSRTLATAASLASAAAVTGMAFGLQDGALNLPLLFAMTFLLDAAQAVAGPTWQALLPRIVGEERTPKAVGTMQATTMIAGMAGPAAGGLLTGWGGPGLVVAVAGGCYLAMGAGALLIRTRRGTAAERAGRPAPALLDGLRLLRRDTLVWALVLGAMFFIVAGEATNVLEVFLARGELGASEAEYGLLAAAFGLGMATGAALAGRIGNGRNRLRALLAAMVLTSALLGATALVPTVAWLFAAYAATGASCGVLNACFGAITILRIPETGRGQAMAILGGMTRAVSIAALALGGLLGAALPVRTSFLATGTAGVLVAAAVAVVVLRIPGAEQSGTDHSGTDQPGGTQSGRNQEAVPDQVGDVVEQPLPEGAAVVALVSAEKGIKRPGDLPGGELAVAR